MSRPKQPLAMCVLLQMCDSLALCLPHSGCRGRQGGSSRGTAWGGGGGSKEGRAEQGLNDSHAGRTPVSQQLKTTSYSPPRLRVGTWPHLTVR